MLRKQQGFTFFQLIVTIAVMGAATLLATQYVVGLVVKQKATETLIKLEELQDAIYGNTALFNTPQRTFLSDMQRLPTSLEELTTNLTNDPNWHGPYWMPSDAGTGFPMNTVNYDAFSEIINWDANNGSFDLSDKTEGIILKEVGADALNEISTIATLRADSLQENLTGNIDGVLTDLTTYTFPHRWHRLQILIHLKYMGSEFLPIEIDMTQERKLFLLHRHGAWYAMSHPDNDVEEEDEADEDDHDGDSHHKWWRKWDRNKERFHENHEGLGDLQSLFNYLNHLPFHYSQWKEHHRTDHYGHDGPQFKLGRFKHTLDKWKLRKWLDDDELKDLITIHPRWDGTYTITDVPVGNYIITAYDSYLLEPLTSDETVCLPHGLKNKIKFKRVDEALKRYVIVRPEKTKTVNFQFTHYFPGHSPADMPADSSGEEPPVATMADQLVASVSDWRIQNKGFNNLTLGNNGSAAITIDKIRVDWNNTAVPSSRTKLRDIYINGNSVWPGGSDKDHGEEVNINNVDIAAGASNIPFALVFKDHNDDMAKVSIEITMSDGSKKVLDESGGGGETPAATMAENLALDVDEWRIDDDRYDELKLGNNGGSVITIDKIRVDWNNTSPTSKRAQLEDIKINGQSVWPGGGDKDNGTLIDIDNYTLAVGASNISFDLRFDDDDDDKATLEFEFTMSDGTMKVVTESDYGAD